MKKESPGGMCEQQKGKVNAGLGFITNVEILSCCDSCLWLYCMPCIVCLK